MQQSISFQVHIIGRKVLNNFENDLKLIYDEHLDVKYHANITAFKTTNKALESGALEKLIENIFFAKNEVFSIFFQQLYIKIFFFFKVLDDERTMISKPVGFLELIKNAWESTTDKVLIVSILSLVSLVLIFGFIGLICVYIKRCK